MNHPICKSAFLGLFFLCLVSPSRGIAAADAEIAYAELLNNYVQDGSVDYQGLKSLEPTLDRYLAHIATADLNPLSRPERMALYINAYNACTLKLILDNFDDGRPVHSIKDIGGFFSKPWDIRFCRVGGKNHTLDEIEHDILRPVFRDPRVHFAVNCASRSCPPLHPEPYRGTVLERQLDRVTTAFINDSASNYLKGERLYVSKIFRWFAEDFPQGVIPFFLRYARGELRERLGAEGSRISVRYLDYDWSLNGL